jgi:tRNA A37 threonylcarbamoyladenosine synthetase subunit TsaC/SUA5/YrdC
MAVLDIQGDAEKVFDTIENGGIAILQLDVAYLICGNKGDAIARIFEAKGRTFEKPNGMLANMEIFEQLLITGDPGKDVVRAVTQDFDLPLSVVAPFRADAPLLAGLDPFAIERSTKAGTQDILINAGPLANRLAEMSLERGTPVLGSSANRSETGSKFRVENIDREVRDAADLIVDYGLCRYHNALGTSSTIIDLQNFEVLRWGVCFEQIRDILSRFFKIDLAPNPLKSGL